MALSMPAAKPLFDYPKYWAECFGPAPFLPMSREEMDLDWDAYLECQKLIVGLKYGAQFWPGADSADASTQMASL